MKQDERTTHFAGFAKAVQRRLDNKVCGISVDEWTPTKSAKMTQDILAQAFYDLVCHTLENIAHIDLDRLCTNEHVLRIPDLTKLPVEE